MCNMFLKCTNIISVRQLISNKCKVTFKNDKCYINNHNGQLIATGLSDGLYKFDWNEVSNVSSINEKIKQLMWLY